MNEDYDSSIQKLLTRYFSMKAVLLMDQISELAGILRDEINYKV
jgi:hypothetical protein